ncbi:MAG: hypothetical protein R2826_06460 [Thermoleophilia bacterium]
MATAEIDSGICGFGAVVHARAEGKVVRIEIDSDCPHVRALAAELTEVSPFAEISFRGEGPQTFRVAAKHLAHAACPVPVGIIKAIEVEAGLALPKEANIRPERD